MELCIIIFTKLFDNEHKLCSMRNKMVGTAYASSSKTFLNRIALTKFTFFVLLPQISAVRKIVNIHGVPTKVCD